MKTRRKTKLQIETDKLTESENYLDQLKQLLAHYERLQHDLEEDIKNIFNRKKYLNNELQVKMNSTEIISLGIEGKYPCLLQNPPISW